MLIHFTSFVLQFAGGRVEGEVGSTAAGQGARLHSFSSLLAFIRSSEPGQN